MEVLRRFAQRMEAVSYTHLDVYKRQDKNGKPCIGVYAGRTHRIVPCPDCKLQPDVLNEIGNTLCDFFAAHNIQPYDEQTGKDVYKRQGPSCTGTPQRASSINPGPYRVLSLIHISLCQ